MKNIFFATALLLSILITGCDISDDSLRTNNSLVNLPKNINNENWMVSFYYDSNYDHTSKFSGFTFRFAGNGIAEAIFNGDTITGTWSSGTDDGFSRMNLLFPEGSLPENINDDWVISSSTESEIRLVDDNRISNETLTFNKQ